MQAAASSRDGFDVLHFPWLLEEVRIELVKGFAELGNQTEGMGPEHRKHQTHGVRLNKDGGLITEKEKTTVSANSDNCVCKLTTRP